MTSNSSFQRGGESDCEKETEKICTRISSYLSTDLKRRGLVVGISGGIDSSNSGSGCEAWERAGLYADARATFRGRTLYQVFTGISLWCPEPA